MKTLTPLVLAAGLLLAFPLYAQDAPESEKEYSESTDTNVTQMEEVRIWGGVRDSLTQTGAPQKVTKESLEAFKYTDVNRALKQAPGIYVREEEGLGLRPNIGLRGTNPDRSKKIVILEDGVLIGPAPYSAPAAYYTPAMNHTESLEIYKGFTAVTYGPNSVGGAINYISRSIQPELRNWIEISGGSFNTFNAKAENSNTTSWGGYLLNVSRRQSDGFKQIDGGGFAGFYQNDVLGKLRFDLPGPNGLHNIDIKLGYAKEDSHETYLGLTESDLDTKPERRYRASVKDEMAWEHFTGQLDHNLQLSDSTFLKTSLYRHDFDRSWYRLDKFNDSNIPSLREIMLNPSSGNNPLYLDILQGEQDSSALGANGELVIFNNHRTYFSHGIQTQFYDELNLGPFQNSFSLSLRVHQDQIDRDHTYDLYEMTSTQMIQSSSAPQNGAQNKEEALAHLISYKNDLTYDRYTLTLAGRFEEVDFEFEDRLTSQKTKRSDSAFIPGIALLGMWTDTFSTKISANKAVTLAGLDPTGKEKREEAWNYEAGFTYFKDDYSPQLEVLYFLNDYSNLTGTCTSSTGCNSNQLDQQFNGGKAVVQGIEARYAQAFQWGKVWIPIQLNGTWIHAEFDNAFSSSSPEWGTGQVYSGDPLPYVPQWQYNLVVGTQYGDWSQELAIIYQGKMYSQSVRTDRKEIEAYGIIDWRGNYAFSQQGSVFITADNILNKTYVSSLNPFGYRPGKPQAFGVGLTYTF